MGVGRVIRLLLRLLLLDSVTSLINYSSEDATKYLRLNAVAICEDDAIRRWSCGDECVATESLVQNGSQVLLGPTDRYNLRGFVARLMQPTGVCLVAIAGTSFYNWRNICADLQFWPADWPSWHTKDGPCSSTAWCEGCKVMKGFAAGYEDIREELFDALKKLQCTELVFTGHSLGGAIAALASLEARACHKLSSSVWTYAMPRVGNLAFVEAYVSAAGAQTQPMWRILHDFDLIPQLPPMWLGYYHIPWAVRYFSNDQEWRTCKDLYEDPGCSYAGGTMADHHNYFGIKDTDENEASPSCISESTMQLKRRDRVVWLTWLCSLATCLIAFLCCCCFFCCKPCGSDADDPEQSHLLSGSETESLANSS